MKHLVVLPAFNEEHALPVTLSQLQKLPEEFELLVVNDGSTDRTGEVAARLARDSKLAVHVVTLPINSGIGAAVQTGYRFASQRGIYTYVIQFDADGQHEADSILRLVRHCESHNLDLCVGSRFLEPRNGGFRSTFARRVGIRFFSRLISLLSATRITDPTSGFRCAGPKAWKSFARRYPDDYPEPESLFWCIRNKLNVGEIPVRMNVRQGGVTSIRFRQSVYYMLKVTLAILIENVRTREQLTG